MNRAYFIDKLKTLGFKKYTPKGDIFRYIDRVFLKSMEFIVSLPPENSSIEVKVFAVGGEVSTMRTFEDYSSASRHITGKDEPEPVKEKVAIKVTRRKKNG